MLSLGLLSPPAQFMMPFQMQRPQSRNSTGGCTFVKSSIGSQETILRRMSAAKKQTCWLLRRKNHLGCFEAFSEALTFEANYDLRIHEKLVLDGERKGGKICCRLAIVRYNTISFKGCQGAPRQLHRSSHSDLRFCCRPRSPPDQDSSAQNIDNSDRLPNCPFVKEL